MNGYDFSFASETLRRLCENEAHGKKILGEKIACALRTRIAEIDAADDASILAILGWSPFEEGGYLGMVYQMNCKELIRWTVNQKQLRTARIDAIDWHEVYRIKLVRIGDHL